MFAAITVAAAYKTMRQLTPEQAGYAEEALERIVGIQGLPWNRNLLSDVFDGLSRAEELDTESHDEMGRWHHLYLMAENGGLYNMPWIDEVSTRFVNDTTSESRRPAWPDERRFALCLTHDVDVVSRQSHFLKFWRRLLRSVKAKGPRELALLYSLGSIYRMLTEYARNDPLGHYEDWLRMEADYGFRSTFYFSPSVYSPEHVYDPDYRYEDPVNFRGRKITVAEMIREIDAAGCEIGLHGTIQSASTPGMLRLQKMELEAVLRHTVISVRQHYLMYDVRITPRLQAEAGFLCDSTVGLTGAPGFRAGTSFPYWCWDWNNMRKLPLLEIPLIIMDTTLFSVSIDQAIERCVGLMDLVQRCGGCLTLNWHPNYINEPIVRVYVTLLQEAARRHAWGCTASELYEWWTRGEELLGERHGSYAKLLSR